MLHTGTLVVPRTGYVDRNAERLDGIIVGTMSYPARGTWIEMRWICTMRYWTPSYPARGTWIEIWRSRSTWYESASRTPHGVRG